MSLAKLKKTLDSFWAGELGFSFKNLRKGEVNILRVKQEINIPPRWPLIALKVDGRCIISLEDRMASDVEKSLENLSAEEVFTTRGIETISARAMKPLEHVISAQKFEGNMGQTGLASYD